MLPMLEILADGKERTMRELTDTIGNRLGLTDADRQVKLPSGGHYELKEVSNDFFNEDDL